MQKWYVETFGAKPAEFGEVKIATLPGATLLFTARILSVPPTKGRALDHIGFEVKDLEDFSKNLEAAGVKFDAPFKRIPQMGFAVAFMCDLWGTRIELTERSAGQ